MESSIAPAIVELLLPNSPPSRPVMLSHFGRHLHCDVTAGFPGINRAFHKELSKRYPPCDVTAAMISPELPPPSSKGT
ncbi:hypothetical protein CPAR01_06434 [Colletotrichum paranaense]|uniref:Uncharacterized protein n=1 Tax=Colletotrichum paranaense TaxID=1914294 RepID=A0ABQ9SLN9_9PEZI|nr:uncharacterized protein CPAR01_06434 [Colletotrichum paranaense]KAK1540445.1 hypothetical protein CPAR01_06434 [Colletotrichum paranaense]